MNAVASENIRSVFKSESKRLLGFIRKRISDRMDAEDILQDVFYQLTIGFRDLERIENLIAWLYRVTNNRIIDQLRKKKPVATSYLEKVGYDGDDPISLEEILPDTGSSPEKEEINRMIWETINQTLSSLPEEQRLVFIAHEFDGFSFGELSERSGIGINTLISRKRYAVVALRENLKQLYKQLKNE